MQTAGMNRHTGKALEGFDHLRQSIADILSTRKGTRVMRREYGSDLAGLVDRPMNASLITAIYAETAEALYRWEPRLRLRRVEADLSGFAEGRIVLTLTGVYVPDGRQVYGDDLVVEWRRP
jgi:phage baseplate assembly protein W